MKPAKFIFNILKKILLFLVLILLGAFLFFGIYLPKKVLKSGDSNIEKWADFYSGKVNTDVLILGSSSGLRGIDTRIIEKKLNLATYNYSNIGMPLANYSRLFSDYLLQNKPLKVLVVNVDVFGLAHRDRLGGPYWLLPEIPYNSRMLNEIYQFRYIKYWKTYGFFYYKDELFKIIQFPNRNTEEMYGFEPQDKKWKLSIDSLNFNNQKFRLDTLAVKKYFNELKQLKQRSGLKELVILMSPIYKHYLESASNHKELTEFIKILAEVNNFKFVDFTQHPVYSSTKNYYDYIHLNYRGSQIYSRSVADTLGKICK